MTKKQEREIVFNKYNGRCAYCGDELLKGWHVDHKEPIVRNSDGSLEKPHNENIENKMPSCASCNINKHSMSLEEFRKLIKGFLKHLNEVNTQYKIAKRYNLVFENDIDIKFYFERFDEVNNMSYLDIEFDHPKIEFEHPKNFIIPTSPPFYNFQFKDEKEFLTGFDGILKKKVNKK